MDKLRYVTLTVLLSAAVAVACSDLRSPTEVASAASVVGRGGDQPEACAQWSCKVIECGHPTWPPYHPCCVRSIYDPPCSYEDPCPVEEEPVCVECLGCDIQDNQCIYSWPDNCDFYAGVSCPGCCEPEDACNSDPVTEEDCEAVEWSSVCSSWPNMEPLDCEEACNAVQ
jgi:hypothetical protein